MKKIQVLHNFTERHFSFKKSLHYEISSQAFETKYVHAVGEFSEPFTGLNISFNFPLSV